MKVFLDTNVLISAFIAHGVCHELFEHCLAEHTICVSAKVLEELRESLAKKFDYSKKRIEQVISLIRANALTLSHVAPPSPICRDPGDNQILAAALNGNVNCLITGDQDLLVLNRVQGMPILKPSDFWEFERQRASR